MPAIARARVNISLNGPDGLTPFKVDYAQSVDEWFGPYTYEVADAVTDQALITIGATGIVTVQFLLIKSDQNISVTLGATGSNASFAVNAGAPLLVAGTTLTAVSVDNASGNIANVSVLLGGT